MATPLISIIVPIYKVEKYLSKCVDSLLNQTYPNMEILLIDDGSPDNCPKICDDYASLYQNIKTFHKQNGGLSDARNYGIRVASGDWIVFVDSDDYVGDNCISDLWHLCEKYNADLAMAKARPEDEFGNPLSRKLQFGDFSITGEKAIFEVYGKAWRVDWNANHKIYKKQLFINTLFPSGYNEDIAIMYKLFEQCKTVAVGDFNQNYHYVQRSGSILNSCLSEKHFHVFEICNDFSAYVKLKYPHYSVLEPIIFARATIQMLQCQKMDFDSFSRVFALHLKFFRKRLITVYATMGLGFKFKFLYLLLCTNSWLYCKCRKINLG